jgi:hypothetical protein
LRSPALAKYTQESSNYCFFLVSNDSAIRLGIGNAGQHESSVNLLVIQKVLFRLVNLTGSNFASAA